MRKFNARVAGIILLFSLSIFISNAQYVYIPDSAFRNFLISDGYAPAFNGDSLDTTNVLLDITDTINCSGRTIQSLEGIQYFKNLSYLNCSVNYLTYLPVLSDSLKMLYCYKNELSSLPVLPSHLKHLYADHNLLTVINDLPAGMQLLQCSNNLLTSLPNLPGSMTDLYCDSNRISDVSVISTSSLVTFTCAYNLLDSLPSLPAISSADCRGS